MRPLQTSRKLTGLLRRLLQSALCQGQTHYLRCSPRNAANKLSSLVEMRLAGARYIPTLIQRTKNTRKGSENERRGNGGKSGAA